MGTRRKYKLKPFILDVKAKEQDFTLGDLKNYLKYGDVRHYTSAQHIVRAPEDMLNIRSLTGSIPLDEDGCWDDVFEYCFGDPGGVGWERFGVGYFDADQANGAARGYQGAIYIPPGEYCIKRRPLNFSGHRVIGVGNINSNNRSIIKVHDSVTGSWDFVAYASVFPTQVMGLSFDANHKTKYGFYAIKCNEFTSHFDTITASNSKSHAVFFDRCQVTTMSRIAGATSATVGSGSGVVFSGCNASRASQVSCNSLATEWGIQVLGGSHMINYEAGFSGGMRLEQPRVELCVSGGIKVAGTGLVSITDSWIETVYGHGVKVLDSIGVVIDRGRITPVDVTDSRVPEGQSRAVYISGSQFITVRNCGIEAPPGGALESEKFERSSGSIVQFTDNFNLYGAGAFNGIEVVVSA
jgi:hypothetical protein